MRLFLNPSVLIEVKTLQHSVLALAKLLSYRGHFIVIVNESCEANADNADNDHQQSREAESEFEVVREGLGYVLFVIQHRHGHGYGRGHYNWFFSKSDMPFVFCYDWFSLDFSHFLFFDRMGFRLQLRFRLGFGLQLHFRCKHFYLIFIFLT